MSIDNDLLFLDEDDDEDAPELPEAEAASGDGSILDRNRNCPQCGREARIVSNHLGIRAYCGPCKSGWPVGPNRSLIQPLIPERGFRRETVVEPDWNLATENLDAYEDYRTRVKRKKTK